MGLKDYIALIRFHYHPSFISVILGALFFAENITIDLFGRLAALYFSFNVLLYGGIYALNDILDIEADKRHPLKRKRSLPSKRVSASSALVFAVCLIMLGLTSGLMLFGADVFYLYLAFLAINLIYTFAAKKIPYLELVFNSLTHPLRFFLGIILVSDKVPYLLLSAIFLLAIGVACVRREVEKDVEGWEARSTLKYYSQEKLIFLKILALILILLLAYFDNSVPKFLYLIVILIHIPLVFGLYLSKSIRNFFRLRWTK